MTNLIYSYLEDKKNLLEYFNCNDDYYIKVLINYKWKIIRDGGISFLSYWTESGERTDAVIVKRFGVPLIYKTDELTMVVALDCIKIAFIFNNTYEN